MTQVQDGAARSSESWRGQRLSREWDLHVSAKRSPGSRLIAQVGFSQVTLNTDTQLCWDTQLPTVPGLFWIFAPTMLRLV